MSDLAVITPTRGRPERFAELVKAVDATAAMDVHVWAGIDYDDPSDYYAACADAPGEDLIVPYRGVRRSLSGWTNFLAAQALNSRNPPRYLASLGDDHHPRSPRWCRKLVDAIESLPGGVGFAYGNDLYAGAALPTAWVVSAEVVRAVGWMMLPGCAHMYVDNAVLELGKAADRIVYRPDVVIEHVHPYAGKAAMDDSYRESNNRHRYAADLRAFEAWKLDGLEADAAKVRALTGVLR